MTDNKSKEAEGREDRIKERKIRGIIEIRKNQEETIGITRKRVNIKVKDSNIEKEMTIDKIKISKGIIENLGTKIMIENQINK